LVGNAGGVLGTPSSWALRWHASGSVSVRGSVFEGSDRNLKQNFEPIDPGDVLSKVAALPITRWSYKDDPTVPHMGPVAQDFREAFGLGRDEKTIAGVDSGGVALAAIQGLNKKVDELLKQQKEQIEALKAEIAAMKSR
jgi:hypothetical protein